MVVVVVVVPAKEGGLFLRRGRPVAFSGTDRYATLLKKLLVCARFLFFCNKASCVLRTNCLVNNGFLMFRAKFEPLFLQLPVS